MFEVVSSTNMTSLKKSILTKSTMEMETEISCHGCTVEWKIYDFEDQEPLASKDIRAPGCDFSWQIGISFQLHMMRVGVQLSDQKEGVLGFYCVIHVTLQNTSGDVLINWTFEQPSLPETFQVGRPSCLRSLLIPNGNGEQFRLCQDDVLVVKVVIVSRGCCTKNKDFKHILE